MNGALLINKHAGVSSFGIIEALRNHLCESQGISKKHLPKMGHGGTLDPFATGLLIVLVGRAVKLARYFLGATKTYEGTVRFGVTTVPGDPTDPISETSDNIPSSLGLLQDLATRLTAQPYSQIPPMHSAKKKNGKPLYELARRGIEIERQPKICNLYRFEFSNYIPPSAGFELQCSSGTYVRTLVQDFGKMLETLALLDSLHRTASGVFKVKDAISLEDLFHSPLKWGDWTDSAFWIPFHRLLDGYPRAYATGEEQQALLHGKQSVLFNILKRRELPQTQTREAEDYLAIYSSPETTGELLAIARKENESWGFERVFTSDES